MGNNIILNDDTIIDLWDIRTGYWDSYKSPQYHIVYNNGYEIKLGENQGKEFIKKLKENSKKEDED